MPLEALAFLPPPSAACRSSIPCPQASKFGRWRALAQPRPRARPLRPAPVCDPLRQRARTPGRPRHGEGGAQRNVRGWATPRCRRSPGFEHFSPSAKAKFISVQNVNLGRPPSPAQVILARYKAALAGASNTDKGLTNADRIGIDEGCNSQPLRLGLSAGIGCPAGHACSAAPACG